MPTQLAKSTTVVVLIITYFTFIQCFHSPGIFYSGLTPDYDYAHYNARLNFSEPVLVAVTPDGPATRMEVNNRFQLLFYRASETGLIRESFDGKFATTVIETEDDVTANTAKNLAYFIDSSPTTFYSASISGGNRKNLGSASFSEKYYAV